MFTSAAPAGTPLQGRAADGPMMFDAAAMVAEARRMHQAMLAGWAMDVLVLRRRRALIPRWIAAGAAALDDEHAEPRRLAA
jgi:uncharacterized protein (DUF2235 family)